MRLKLNCIVFVCGASVMILELCGTRIVAPFLGSSIYIWTSLIGVILASLSIGYRWGGQLADASPTFERFSRVLLGASTATILIAPLQFPILVKLGASGLDLRVAAVLGALLLFALPSVLLGCATPFALRLAIDDISRSGAVAGSLYACSTVGSIIGTFLGGFVLIAWLGSIDVVLLVAFLLLLCSTFACPRDKPIVKACVLVVIGLIYYLLLSLESELTRQGMRDFDTQYQRVLVMDTKQRGDERKMRVMLTDPLGSQSAMYIDNPTELAAEYSKLYDLAFAAVPGLEKALMIGGGAYSYPKHFLSAQPHATLDVVEIDPGITDIARLFFNLEDNPRLKIIHEDARTFLNRQNDLYDVVFVDAFSSSPSIPFQLTTFEAAREISRALNDNGVAIVNMISGIDGPEGRFLRAELATYRAVFPKVLVFATEQLDVGEEPQNVILLAFKDKGASLPEPHLSPYEALLDRQWLTPIASDMPLLTDRRAPVEHYILPALKQLGRKLGENSWPSRRSS